MNREQFINNLRVDNIEKKDESSRNRVTEFIDIMTILREKGVNISKIKQTIDKRPTIIEDINQDEINIGEICGKYDIPMDYPIGNMIKYMKAAIKGQGKVMALTDRQKEELCDVLKSRKPAMQELIEVLHLLRNCGIDVKNIQVKYKDNKTSKTLKLSDYLFEDNIISKIEKAGYDEEFPLGKRILEAREIVSNEKSRYHYSNEQRQELSKLVGGTRAYSIER